MKSMQMRVKSIVGAAIYVMLASPVGYAGGFSLYTEGSGAAIGHFAAGVAAEASDASIGWYNPAGLVFLGKQQAVLSGVGVLPSTKVSGVSTFATQGFQPYIQNFRDLQASKQALVPAFHYALPLSERAAFGLSVVSPFGLSTEYADTSPVRYAATLTGLLTANVSPALSAQVSKHFAIGAGLDLQWSQVKFNRVLGAPPLLIAGGNAPTAFDSRSDNEGQSFGVGFHVGILGTFNEHHTRLGLNYQSKMKHTFHGHSELIGPFADPFIRNPQARFRSDSLYSNDIQLPDVLTLSVYQDVDERWALLGSAVHTGWQGFRIIQLNQVAVFSPNLGQVIVDTTTIQNYQDAWRFAVGVNYHLNDQWLLRVGGGYDQTPTVDVQRDVRLPDANRWALSIGSHYQMLPCLGFDVGYTYLLANQEAIINKREALGATSSYAVDARAKAHAHLIGLQAVWTIDKS